MGDQGNGESPAAGPPGEDAAAPRVEPPSTGAERVRPGENPPRSNEELRIRNVEPERAVDDLTRLPDALDVPIDALKRALRAAEEASRTKDLFLATLAHDLRTPLQAMLMQAELLRRAAPQDPVVARATGAIARAGNLQSRLIQDLLDVSGILSGSLRRAGDLQGIAGIRILVVDDDGDVRDPLLALLARGGGVTCGASSAAEALEMVAVFKPDVLLCDIAMPGEDGFDLVARLRALPADRGGGVPAVALTAFAASRDREQALASGFQAHIAKPVDVGELLRVVAMLATRTEPADVP